MSEKENMIFVDPKLQPIQGFTTSQLRVDGVAPVVIKILILQRIQKLGHRLCSQRDIAFLRRAQGLFNARLHRSEHRQIFRFAAENLICFLWL